MNPEHKVGDTVHILPSTSALYAGTYQVTKVNPRTYRLASEVHDNVRAAHEHVHAGPMPALAPLTPHSVNLQPGTAVRFTRGHTTDKEQIFVITGNAPRGYRLFPLGGSRRYHTNVPATMFEIVTRIDGWTASIS